MEKKVRNDSAVMAVLGLIIMLGAAIFVITLFNGTKKEPEVLIEGNKISIKGQYGVTYDIPDISDIQLVDEMPAVGDKVNGAGLGEVKKGDYNVEGLGRCRLFILTKEKPFIYIIVNNKYTIINFKDPSKTMTVYDELKKALEARGK